MATLKFKLKRSYFAFPYAFLAVLFVVIPLVLLIFFAFQDSNGAFTFGNFINFFTREGLGRVMWRSFSVALCTTVICLILAYPIALILTNSKLNKHAILIVLFVLPMWINSVLRTYAVKSFFDITGVGFSNYIKVIIAMVYDFFPFMLLPIYTILANLDKSYSEAASDLGANSFFTLLKVKFPLSITGMVSGIMMVFMPTVSTFAISEIVADGTDMYLFGNLINNYFTYNSDTYNIGSAYALVLLIIIALTVFIANKITGGKIQPQAKGGGGVL